VGYHACPHAGGALGEEDRSRVRRKAKRLGPLVLAGLLASLFGAVPARAQSSGSGDQATIDAQKAQIEKVRAQRAATASQVDGLKANDQQITAALDDLDANVRGQEGLLESARRKAGDADTASAEAQAQEQQAQAVLDARRVAAHQAALDAYTSPPSQLSSLASTGELEDELLRRALSGLHAQQSADALDNLDAAQQDLTTKRKRAGDAAARAVARRDEAQQRLVKLQTALDEQQQLSNTVESKLEGALAESAALASVDEKLSADLFAQETALAQRLAAARALAQRASGGTYGQGGGPTSVAPVALATVGGITVNVAIADQLASMLQAASAAGINLGGMGYRSAQAQIEVRRRNCGGTQYDIWQRPASSCNPPAARPGQSRHEQGLAIDFTCDGVLITSHSNGCYQWLANNAANYGLHNLASEPWHWSVDGN
jgi:peptidoglycan hydrolase CwlO-like protein